MRPIATLLLASILALPDAIGQERSDALLHAFREACFPRRDDLTSQRQKITEAGFAQVPVETIPEFRAATNLLDTAAKFFGLPGGAQQYLPVFETYRGQRDGIDLVAVLRVSVGCYFKDTACVVHDFGATGPVTQKKMVEWIGRPSDRGASTWVSGIAALPGGYHKLQSSYRSPQPKYSLHGALLSATATTSRVPPCK